MTLFYRGGISIWSMAILHARGHKFHPAFSMAIKTLLRTVFIGLEVFWFLSKAVQGLFNLQNE